MLKNPKLINNNSGMAIFEMIPILIIIVILLNFSYGFFGVIHTGILNSIAARNYAFETFRNRSSLWYFREYKIPGGKSFPYHNLNSRFHAIASDKRAQDSDAAVASEREIAFGTGFGQSDRVGESLSIHNREIASIKDDGTRFKGKEGVNPVWIRPAYGICLNSVCQWNPR